MDMLVRLYDLPDSREAFARAAAAGVVIRRALAPEKHKVLEWVRSQFSAAWASAATAA